MHRGFPVRVLLATALAAGTLTVLSVAAPSGAATKVTCKKEVSKVPVVNGSTTTVKATLTGCSTSVGGKGTSITTIKGQNKPVSKTTWANGKGTTTQTVLSYKATTLGQCKAGETRLIIKSKVTANTGAAKKVIKVGTIDTSYTCEKGDLSSYSEPGRKVTF
jgi:hypothetical protein